MTVPAPHVYDMRLDYVLMISLLIGAAIAGLVGQRP